MRKHQERPFNTRRLELGLGLEEDLVGVELDRMRCERKGKSNGRQVVEPKRGTEGKIGCGQAVAEAMSAQPAINSAWKVPSAEGALRALIRALVIEGKKIWKNVF